MDYSEPAASVVLFFFDLTHFWGASDLSEFTSEFTSTKWRELSLQLLKTFALNKYRHSELGEQLEAGLLSLCKAQCHVTTVHSVLIVLA